jgi:hypothetical protein
MSPVVARWNARFQGRVAQRMGWMEQGQKTDADLLGRLPLKEQGLVMADSDLSDLRELAARGDNDAVDQLVELAGERGDMDDLRLLAGNDSRDAADQLVELATERGDLTELRRLAAGGNRDAADVLAELAEEQDDEAG